MLAAAPAVLFALLSSSTLAVPAAAALNARSSAQPLAIRSDFGDLNALNARSAQPFNPIEERDASGLVGIFGDLISLFLKRDEGSDASISKRDIVVLADIVARSSQSADPTEKRDASQIVGIIGDLLGFVRFPFHHRD
ncbi:hypothetical protein DL93DRAFT_2083367 [Clavulina sp. PMI_390]|nr:hypothetical protein DL93DRAFT_2083367 [Clavulina sp. PMI_390]